MGRNEEEPAAISENNTNVILIIKLIIKLGFYTVAIFLIDHRHRNKPARNHFAKI
jgi:hypothetical protein